MASVFSSNPTTRQLRQFGGSSLVALPLVAWLALGRPGPDDWQPTHTAWIISGVGIGLLLYIGAMAWPRAIRPIYLAILCVTWPIGVVISELMLLAIFAVVFTPVALVFRLISRDALSRRMDRETRTYWRARAQSPTSESYFRQS